MVKSLWQRLVNPDRVFIIAEVGVNHNGNVGMAKRLIDIAVNCGADAVKFQTFKAEKLVCANAPKAKYQIVNTTLDESQFQMLKRLELSPCAHHELFSYCQRKGIIFLSTPFDEESADFLYDLGVKIFKIPSGEITNLPFLKYLARKNCPLILSTGMSTLKEVKEALKVIRSAGPAKIVLLHCVSNYPAQPKEINLRAMEALFKAFHRPVGFSDHTLGIDIALAAVARGACVLEKHFTLDCQLKGPDHKVSLKPSQLKSLVSGVRNIELALGHGRKEPVESEKAIARVARKSLVALCEIPAGTILTDEMITVKRPGTGIPPAIKDRLLGRKTRVRIKADQLLTMEMLV